MGVFIFVRKAEQPRRNVSDEAMPLGGCWLTYGGCALGRSGCFPQRNDLIDLVGTEAHPVVVTGDDDRCRHVAGALDELEQLGVLREVDHEVQNTIAVELPVGRPALHARRLREEDGLDLVLEQLAELCDGFCLDGVLLFGREILGIRDRQFQCHVCLSFVQSDPAGQNLVAVCRVGRSKVYLVQELLRALVKEYYPLQVYSTLQSGREHMVILDL